MDSTARTDVARLLSGREVTVTLPWDMWEALVAGEKLEPGKECPTCHRKMPSKNARRQAAYRERKA